MSRRRYRLGLAAAACALASGGALSGCGGSTKTVTVTAASTTSAATGTPASTGTATAGGTGTGTTAAPAPSQSSSTPLATATSSWDGEPVRLDVLSVTRSGAVAQVSVRLTNTGRSTPHSQDNVQVANLFSGAQGSGSTKLYDTLAGLVLIDAAQNREYPTARNAHGACVCDGDLDETYVDPGQSSVLSATFGAPPASVGTVDLLVPHFGTFHDLPISGS